MARSNKKRPPGIGQPRVDPCSVAFAKLGSDPTIDASDLMNLVHDQFAEHFTGKKPFSNEECDREGDD